MEFLLHEKDLWDITPRKLLPLEVEFRDIVLEGSILKHCLFMKKNKLAHGTILLNVIDSLLHHVTSVKITKDALEFVQHLKENMLATNCNDIKSFIILKLKKAP
jgi:hypothetical protein